MTLCRWCESVPSLGAYPWCSAECELRDRATEGWGERTPQAVVLERETVARFAVVREGAHR